ncbi:MAG TPA: hypothetical protein VJO34_16765 [Methylomirabilota bacterium]|nr:hypothetical protein [Methylomirabilota bacterium]
MIDHDYDPEYLKSIFDQTEVLRKPITGIIAGYHVLPYILVGPQEHQPSRSIEIRGKIRVSPRLIISPSQLGQTYGEVFGEREVMDQALVARVFSFLYTPRQQVKLENEDLKIARFDRDPHSQINRALDELAQGEIIDTGLILSPNVKLYPISIDRFINEILDREFRW